MVAYSSQELVSSSDFAKKFGSYLAQLKGNVVEKIAILKNNNIEAVLVPKEDYEAMKQAWELQEHRAMLDASLEEYRENSSKNFSELDKTYWSDVKSRLIARQNSGE